MTPFLIICFIIATAIAKPASIGYGYLPVRSSAEHFVSSIGSASPVYNRPNSFIQQQPQQQHYRQSLAPIVTKNFYIHSAPEETPEEIQQEINNYRQARRHYNVVFIKAPTHSIRSTTLSLAQALNEERTVIYVLSKKPDITEIQSALHEAPLVQNKPEVFFIKYKTNEEAQHAQHQIQAQYDALGGSTLVSDEGIAPVTSVIGSLGAGDDGSSGIGSSVLIAGSSNNVGSIVRGSNYLPPQKRI